MRAFPKNSLPRGCFHKYFNLELFISTFNLYLPPQSLLPNNCDNIYATHPFHRFDFNSSLSHSWACPLVKISWKREKKDICGGFYHTRRLTLLIFYVCFFFIECRMSVSISASAVDESPIRCLVREKGCVHWALSVYR